MQNPSPSPYPSCSGLLASAGTAALDHWWCRTIRMLWFTRGGGHRPHYTWHRRAAVYTPCGWSCLSPSTVWPPPTACVSRRVCSSAMYRCACVFYVLCEPLVLFWNVFNPTHSELVTLWPLSANQTCLGYDIGQRVRAAATALPPSHLSKQTWYEDHDWKWLGFRTQCSCGMTALVFILEEFRFLVRHSKRCGVIIDRSGHARRHRNVPQFRPV